MQHNPIELAAHPVDDTAERERVERLLRVAWFLTPLDKRPLTIKQSGPAGSGPDAICHWTTTTPEVAHAFEIVEGKRQHPDYGWYLETSFQSENNSYTTWGREVARLDEEITSLPVHGAKKVLKIGLTTLASGAVAVGFSWFTDSEKLRDLWRNRLLDRTESVAA